MTRPLSLNMALLDFILNLVGLLLWFNWRAAQFDPLSKSTPATLAGTLRRAETSRLQRWHLPLVLLGLLLIRAPLYAMVGGALNWVGKLDVVIISIPFKSNSTSYLPMLLYSIYSFGVALGAFLLWVLLLSILKSDASENDSLRQLLRLHLGRLESAPILIKLILPLIVVLPVWYLASWPLTFWEILPKPGELNRLEQAFLVSLGSYLVWKQIIVAVLALHFISTYVYFGKNPFWQHLSIVARKLLRPFSGIPLNIGRFSFAPLLAIALTLLVCLLIERGIHLPWGSDNNGRPKARWLDVPGLVDLYRRSTS